MLITLRAYKRRDLYPRGLTTGLIKSASKQARAVLFTVRFILYWIEIWRKFGGGLYRERAARWGGF